MSDELLPGIREKILAGTLPKQNCHVTWYGHGTGGISWRASGPSRLTTWRWSVISRAAARSGSIGSATRSGRRSGRAARAHDMRAEKIFRIWSEPSR
jgi:hypothetical protein